MMIKLYCDYLVYSGIVETTIPPILVPFSAKRIATQILVISKLNGRKDFIFSGFDWFYFEPP